MVQKLQLLIEDPVNCFEFHTCGPPGILASLNELLRTVCLLKSINASVCLLSLNLSILMGVIKIAMQVALIVVL